MEFTIRKATSKDAEEIAKLYIQFWEPHKGVDPLIELDKKLNLTSQIDVAKSDIRKKDTYVFVAIKENKVVGYIELLIKSNDKMFKIKKYGYLNSAATHKDYRGQGIARILTEFGMIFLKSKGIKYVKTNVYNTNDVAMSTWKKLGFVEQSTNLVRILK